MDFPVIASARASSRTAESSFAAAGGQAAAAVVAIAAAEIIPRAEQTLRSLQETRFQLAADSDAALSSLRKEIEAFAEKSDRRWQSEAAVITSSQSLQRLNDVLREWSLEESRLDGWDRALSRRSQILVAQENDVEKIIQTWNGTRASGKQQRFPAVALQKIAEVSREADAVRGLIRGSMSQLLSLQLQLANRRDFLAKIRIDIDKARDRSSRQLFIIDSLPLWGALLQPAARDVIVVQAIQSSHRFAEDLDDFVQKYRDRLIWHTLFFVGLMVLFRFLGRGLTLEAIERLGGASALLILHREFSAAGLLALVALPLFYPGAAPAVIRLGALLTVVPMIRLLPGLLARRFRPWVYLLVSMYVLDFIRYLFPLRAF